LVDYDFIIRLKKGDNESGAAFKNLLGQTWKDALVGFDPIKYFLRDLEVNWVSDFV